MFEPNGEVRPIPTVTGRERRCTKGSKIGTHIEMAWRWRDDTPTKVTSCINTGRALVFDRPSHESRPNNTLDATLPESILLD